jgi:dipeptidase
MGANEHGVVIGNEAVFTKIPYGKTPGLIGMDLLRLALERAPTARAALDVITALLAQYGQSGNCGYQHATYYHNSFLIADPRDAWVLETADKHWAAERVRDIRTISNGLTIGNQFDLASPDLVNYAIERGWCNSRDAFHFARCYSDFLFTRFSQSRVRQCRTTALLAAQRGKITVETMTRVLRDHGDDANWLPARGVASFDVCAHAGWGPIRGTQTTGSLVAHLTPTAQTHFVTGTAAPCTSIFKPVWLDAGVPHAAEPAPTGENDAATLFWRHEQLHRATLRDYAPRRALYRAERDALEQQMIADALACREQSREERRVCSARAFAQADEAEKQWTARVLAHAAKKRHGFL